MLRLSGVFAIAIVAGISLLARPVGAQEAARQTQEQSRASAQRLEEIVAIALREADQVGRSKPARAVEILRVAQDQVAASAGALEAERREALLRKLRFNSAAWSERVDKQAKVAPQGSWIEADLRRDRKEFEEQLRLMQQTERIIPIPPAPPPSAPPIGGVDFPRDWRLRFLVPSRAPPLTEKERQILRGLDAHVAIDLAGKDFEEFRAAIQAKSGLPIAVDPGAKEAVNKADRTLVNLSVRGSTRKVLKGMLDDVGLTYAIKDETILITTPARAREMLITREYAPADLLPLVAMQRADRATPLEAYQAIQQMVVRVPQTVEPQSWAVNDKGGAGTIVFDPARFVLIVKQSAEVHYWIGRAR
jgi:hypothetical protein